MGNSLGHQYFPQEIISGEEGCGSNCGPLVIVYQILVVAAFQRKGIPMSKGKIQQTGFLLPESGEWKQTGMKTFQTWKVHP